MATTEEVKAIFWNDGDHIKSCSLNDQEKVTTSALHKGNITGRGQTNHLQRISESFVCGIIKLSFQFSRLADLIELRNFRKARQGIEIE
jgi:hypothetical protein